MKEYEISDSVLAEVSGGPEERTVLGLKAAADCRKCNNCGTIIENNSLLLCPGCGEKIAPGSDSAY